MGGDPGGGEGEESSPGNDNRGYPVAGYGGRVGSGGWVFGRLAGVGSGESKVGEGDGDEGGVGVEVKIVKVPYQIVTERLFYF